MVAAITILRCSHLESRETDALACSVSAALRAASTTTWSKETTTTRRTLPKIAGVTAHPAHSARTQFRNSRWDKELIKPNSAAPQEEASIWCCALAPTN